MGWGDLPDGPRPRDRRARRARRRRGREAARRRSRRRRLHGGRLSHVRELPARPRAVLRSGRGLHLQLHRDGLQDAHVRRLLQGDRGGRAVRPQDRAGAGARSRRAAAVRRHHHLVPAPPLEGGEGKPRRRRRARGARAHGGEARRRPRRRGDDALHVRREGAGRPEARRARVRAHLLERRLPKARRSFRSHRGHDLRAARPEPLPRDGEGGRRDGAPRRPSGGRAGQRVLPDRGRKTLAGSLIGGVAETQELLDFCAAQRSPPTWR